MNCMKRTCIVTQPCREIEKCFAFPAIFRVVAIVDTQRKCVASFSGCSILAQTPTRSGTMYVYVCESALALAHQHRTITTKNKIVIIIIVIIINNEKNFSHSVEECVGAACIYRFRPEAPNKYMAVLVEHAWACVWIVYCQRIAILRILNCRRQWEWTTRWCWAHGIRQQAEHAHSLAFLHAQMCTSSCHSRPFRYVLHCMHIAYTYMCVIW